MACKRILVVAAAAALAQAAEVTPLGKVMTLLEDFFAKGKKDLKDDEAKFTVFSKWCKDQTATKTGEIKEDGLRVATQKATIEKASSTIREANLALTQLSQGLEKNAAEQQKANTVRSKEAADFLANLKDITESVDAIDKAISTIKAGSAKKDVKRSLLQVKMSAEHQNVVQAFLEEAAPKSNGIVTLLEKLKAQFSTQRSQQEQTEIKAKESHVALMKNLGSAADLAQKEVTTKTASVAQAKQTVAQATSALATAEKEEAEDKKYLSDTQAMCATKHTDFADRSKLRKSEIEALGKAIEVLKTKVAPKAAFLQQSSTASAFAQLRTSSQLVKARIAEFLDSRAQVLQSQTLTMLAQQAAEDPLAKVREMINGMIDKLEKAAEQDGNQQQFCEGELKENKAAKEEKTLAADKLKAQVSSTKATIGQLNQETKELAIKLQELDKARAKASAERTASKQKLEETIKSAKEAQAGVQEATEVLRKFYQSPAVAGAFVQEEQKPAPAAAPETFNGPYKGVAPGGGNILDFMEVVMSDYARLQAEAEAQESNEGKQYSKFMSDSETDKAVQTQEMKLKETKKVEQASTLQESEEYLKNTVTQLAKIVEYEDKLKKQCGPNIVDPEEKARKRKEEIKSLEEALKIFDQSPAAAPAK